MESLLGVMQGGAWFDRVLRGEGLQRPLWLRLALTLLVVGAAVLVQLALFAAPAGLAFLTLYPAALLCAIFFGDACGALATLLGAVVGTTFFMQPFGSLALTSERVLAAALFILSGAPTCLVAQRLRLAAFQFRQSEECARTLFDASPHGQIYLEPGSLRILQCNAAAAQALGYSVQELSSMRAMELTVDPDPLADRSLQTRLLANEKLQADIKLRHKDGTLRDMTATLVALKTAAGLRFHANLLDITELRHVQAELRLAVIGFESGDGAVVMDQNGIIVRANKCILRASGFSEQELLGQNASFVRSNRHPPSFYEEIANEFRRTGTWRGDMWLRNKSGEDVAVWCTLTTVFDAQGNLTHLVGNYADATTRNLQEQQRLRNEAAHRHSLVREVHHRIKNHLQGVMGILHRFSKNHPETEAHMRQAIAQVQSISIIHGLQGQSNTSSVPLHDMLIAIARSVQDLWQTTVALEIAPEATPYLIAEDESVPIALVLNELIMNAVKHGGKSAGHVSVGLGQGGAADVAQIRICNAGRFNFDRNRTDHVHSGLDLIDALMPRNGGRIAREQLGDQVMTTVEFEPPVVSLPAPASARQESVAQMLA